MRGFVAAFCLLAASADGISRAGDVEVGPIGSLVAESTSEMAPAVVRWAVDGSDAKGPREVDSWEGSRRRSREFAAAWAARLREMDFDALGLEGKIDYLLLANELRATAESAKFVAGRDAEVAPFVPFAAAVEALVAARYRLVPVDPEKAAGTLVAIRKQVDEVRKQAEARKPDDKIPAHLADRAAGVIEANRRALAGWFEGYDGFDPLFSWWTRDPHRKADEGLRELVKYLRETVAGVKDGDRSALVAPPIGREEIEAALRAEMIAYSPEELLAVGEREFAWCDAERRKAAAELGFGDDWKAAADKVKKDHVEPGGQYRMIRGLVEETLAFVDARDLVTIPPLARESWTVHTTPADDQKHQPYYFYSGGAISMAYPADRMDHEGKLMAMRSNNVHFTKNLAMHELIPGHHLQMFMNARHQPHRRSFGTPFWTEGWALYWEILLWDLGFPKTPEDRLGLLFWRTHRCARIVFSLKYHLGKMTSQEAIDYLVDQVGHERSSAEGEVRRSLAGGYGPLYQASYMLGGLQFRALSKELVDSGKMTHKAFHDRILTGGPMPVELVRARLTDAKLTRDFTPSWKFAGEAPK
ncbi:DUF885 family protein [Paludisphaera mucosa]|uniref:DUF885 family protein n=1 Tax=Paludisphaera mucosa TaxID=3030827 RepID=A0ABT6F417_9BACT|nr:DUF885 family protein [Paludisphaera mucosa]MDG3002331.1 DUF885 family protein [Paludisphaera mucosa]